MLAILLIHFGSKLINMARKIKIQLSEKAEKYFNEVMYSLDFGTGKEPTILDVVNYIIETLGDIEESVGDPLTFLQEHTK